MQKNENWTHEFETILGGKYTMYFTKNGDDWVFGLYNGSTCIGEKKCRKWHEPDNFVYFADKCITHPDDSNVDCAYLDTSIEQEIQNTFEKAGKLLYCDHITVSDLQETELAIDGVCKMCYKREKHIDEQKRIQEQLRLHDMLRMAFDGVFQWVEFTEFLPMKYNDEYDIVKIPFELGKIRNKD